jgi:hypothetical protein
MIRMREFEVRLLEGGFTAIGPFRGIWCANRTKENSARATSPSLQRFFSGGCLIVRFLKPARAIDQRSQSEHTAKANLTLYWLALPRYLGFFSGAFISSRSGIMNALQCRPVDAGRVRQI